MDAEVEVASFDGRASILSFLKKLRILATKTASIRLKHFRRHATLFKRKLRLASFRKNGGIVAPDLPFKAKLQEVVNLVAISSNHFPGRIASEHTDNILQVVVAVQAKRHEVLVVLKVNGSGTETQTVETTFDISTGVMFEIVELKRVLTIVAERHGKAFVLVVSAFETEAAVGHLQNVPTDLRKSGRPE